MTESSSPPWASAPIPAGYSIEWNGVSIASWEPGGGSKRLTQNPAWVSGIMRNGSGAGWTFVLNWLSLDGVQCEVMLPWLFLTSNLPAYNEILANKGLAILASKAFRSYLQDATEDERVPVWLCVDRIGFTTVSVSMDRNTLCYVLPQETLYPRCVENPPLVRLLSAGLAASKNGYYASGTLDDWRDCMQATRRHPLQTFSLCAALAGILQSAAAEENGGVHFYGPSSRGKTLALQLACTVFGNGTAPNQDARAPSLLNSWSSTDNALDLIANAHSDTLLAIDELGVREGAAPVYRLLNGQGKARMTRTADMQQRKTWTITVLSTGEIPMHGDKEGRVAKQGEMIRMIDIPIDDLSPPGAAEQAEALKKACRTVFGTAGPAFAQNVLDFFGGDKTEMERQITYQVDLERDKLRQRLIDRGVTLHAHHDRALRRFALVAVAGIWAAVEDDQEAATDQLPVLPHTETEVLEAVHAVLDAWINSQTYISEDDRAITVVRDYVMRHRAQFAIATGQRGGGHTLPPNCRGIERGQDLLLNDSQFRDACGSLHTRLVAKALHKANILVRDGDQYKPKVSVPEFGIIKVRHYVLKLNRLLTEDVFEEGAELEEVAHPSSQGLSAPQPRRRATTLDDL